jgi:hypothetical protein
MTDEQQKYIKQFIAEHHAQLEKSAFDEFLASEDYNAFISSIIQYIQNGGMERLINIKLVRSVPEVNERLFKLFRRGYHEEHPRWNSERMTLVQLIKNSLPT